MARWIPRPAIASELTDLIYQAGLTTAPDRIQRVQTRAFFTPPESVTMRTRFKLGSQRRLVLLCAWETLFPVTGPFPQI